MNNSYNIRASVLADARSTRPDLARLSDEAFIDRALAFFSDNSTVRPRFRNPISRVNLSVVPAGEPVDELTGRMRAVYGYMVKREVAATARTVQRGDLKLLQGFNADDIRALLEQMATDGYLQFQDGKYHVNPNKMP